jgi:hypothetical protein
LLAQILNFQFVYPSDKGIVPSWLFKELLQLAEKQFDLPPPVTKVCLGPLIDYTNYEIDIKEWNYKSLTHIPQNSQVVATDEVNSVSFLQNL